MRAPDAQRPGGAAGRVVVKTDRAWALTLGWGAAFCMHLGVSWRTRSFMPGTATSIVPGLPGTAFVLWRIRSLTRPDEAR